MRTNILLLLLGLFIFAGQAEAVTEPTALGEAKSERNRAWLGAFGSTAHSYYAYAGIVHSFDDNNKDGLLIRASGGLGRYRYNSDAVAAGNVEGDVGAFDLMAGYQKYFTFLEETAIPGRLSVYAGPHFESHDLRPEDPDNRVDGPEWGVKGLAELVVDPIEKLQLNLAGSYSTVHDGYWSKASAGYHFGYFSIGPQASFLGNDGFDQQQFGGHISGIKLGDVAEVSFSGGWSRGGRGGGNSLFGGISFFKEW